MKISCYDHYHLNISIMREKKNNNNRKEQMIFKGAREIYPT